MKNVEDLMDRVSVTALCNAMGIARATAYRLWGIPIEKQKKTGASPRALSQTENQAVLDILHSSRFIDQSPQEVYATLLDEGQYLCSIRTMYRLLDRHNEVRERRAVVAHRNYKKPELLATGPNQVWSWDITKLMGPEKWTYFYLYVLLDIFSRYVVGWMIADRESGELAKVLIAEACERQKIEEKSLTIHSDRGSPMISKPVAFLMADLGITKSLSRPHVSNDNPFSEAQFKTLKYSPEFPDRFGCKQDAEVFSRRFFPWYNDEHKHSGIAFYTPSAVHYGQSEVLHAVRAQTLSAAFMAHPERFVKKAPVPAMPPVKVWINPPPQKEVQANDNVRLAA